MILEAYFKLISLILCKVRSHERGRSLLDSKGGSSIRKLEAPDEVIISVLAISRALSMFRMQTVKYYSGKKQLEICGFSR